MAQQILEIRVSHKGIKPVRNGHPWIFKNALAGSPRPARVSSSLERSFFGPDGLFWHLTTPALICDQSGEHLGWGSYNPHSRLAARMLSRDPSVPFLTEGLIGMVQAAVDQRSILFADPKHTAFRLIYGEADGIPGVVADMFGEVVSVQYSGAFAWDNAAVIEKALIEACATYGVAVRTVRTVDEVMFQREGITSAGVAGAGISDGVQSRGAAADDAADDVASDTVAGAVAAKAESSPISVLENGLSWMVFPGDGQKTGLYCDQRENRMRVGRYARDARVLDAFCYHGGFGFHALHAGARSVCFADRSADALAMVRRNGAVQGVDAGQYECIDGDLFERLRHNDIPGGLESYDLVILDPPKLVPARKNLAEGLRAYKDLHLSLLKFLRPGARVMTFSCSGAVGAGDFRRVVAWAAADCGRSVVVEDIFTQSADHPVPVSFPEAEYLTGLLLYIRNDRQCGTIHRR